MPIQFQDKYAPPLPDPKLIPASMRSVKRWVCWGGDKVPVNGNRKNSDGYYTGANITNPDSWMPFDEARWLLNKPACVQGEYFHICGIGFVVGDGWFCLDADGGEGHGREPVPEALIQDFIQRTGTYAEKSLSGAGYHLFGRCDFTTEEGREHFSESKTSFELEFFTRRKFVIVLGESTITFFKDAIDCSQAAREIYEEFVLRPCQRREEAEREKRKSRPIRADADPSAAGEFFRLNWREILSFADPDHFKRSDPGPGEYSWIGALHALQSAGVPREDIIQWCERGSTFAGIRDVERVLDETKSVSRPASVGSLIKDAMANGWKPDPDKLTGEYKEAHERGQREAAEAEEWYLLMKTQLACKNRGIEFRDTIIGNFDYEGHCLSLVDSETGEILWEAGKQPEKAAHGADEQMTDEDYLNGLRATFGEEAVQVMENPPGMDVHIVPQAKPEAWKTIETLPPLPEFPLEVFPEWLQQYIQNYHENTGVSTDFCSACVLGAISTAVNGHLVIHFNSTLYEAAQLYILFVGKSGTMKSATLSEFYRPVSTWLLEKNKTVMENNAVTMKHIREAEERLKQKNVKNPGEISAKIKELRERLELEYPVRKTDVTPEALARNMVATGGCATIASAEGNIVNMLTGSNGTQKGAVPNLDIFLQGSDNEPVSISRVTTGDTVIEKASLSLLLAVQPDLLQELFRNRQAVGRGLVPRFLIASPEREYTPVDHTQPNTTNRDLAARWARFLTSLAERFMHPGENAIAFELRPDADMAIRQLWNQTDEMVNQYAEESIRSWIGKMRGKALRLSAIFALLDEPGSSIISPDHTSRAIALMNGYFLPHFRRPYEQENALSGYERAIIRWIQQHSARNDGLDVFRQKDLKSYIRQLKIFRGKPSKFMDELLESLQEKGYVRPFSNGQSRTLLWQINPALIQR